MRQRHDLNFSLPEYTRRLQAVQRQLVARELAACIVTTPENITYLTGYQTTGYYYLQALVVPQAAEPFMVTRLLEDSNVQARTWVEHSYAYNDIECGLAKLQYALCDRDLSAKRLGYEKNCYFLRNGEQQQLLAGLPNATFIDCSGLVEQERLLKSTEEIAVLRRAAQAADAGMLAAINATVVGVSENDIAAELHHAMFKAGGEYPACSPFVASGPRCALGHATWEGRCLHANDYVFLEVGGCVQRYHVAMMRTVYLGRPNAIMREAETLLQHTMQACIEGIKPGVPAAAIDDLSRTMLAQNSFGAVQTTRSGYSIGLAYAPDWGEGHIFSIQSDNQRPLQENMVLHLIPWIQIPGEAGIGLSETVHITHNSCVPLGQVPRQLFVKDG